VCVIIELLSSGEDASSTSSLDSLFSSLGEFLGLNNNWNVRNSTLSEDFEVTLFVLDI